MYCKLHQTRSSNAKENRNYVQWSSEMDRWLAKLLAAEVKNGNKTDNILKPEAYMGALTVINKKFGLDLTKEHIKNRLKTWKKQFGILKEILVHKGFLWDEKQRMVVSDAAVWNDYIKAHPDARKFQERSIENYDDLCIILGNNHALAGCLESDSEAHMQSAASRDALDSASSSGIQSDDNHVKTLRWTDAMDYYLGKSLVEKVKEGYKMDNTLWQEAYDAAISTLSEKIGLELTKDHIKNRLKTWKNQYDALKQLFSHLGFKWDKTRKMVIADDSIWTNYVKAHPDAGIFHGRVIENYDNLCTIFGNDNELAEAVDIYPVQNSGKVKDQAKNMMWTYEMDQCLSKVLAEQVKLGKKSKLGNKLRPPAYVEAVSVMNKRFQLDLTREHIRNRLKTWKKQYEILKGLLHQSEFTWDKTQTMVIANDSAWSQYIKINPDARSF